jgi:hypothetical protein
VASVWAEHFVGESYRLYATYVELDSQYIGIIEIKLCRLTPVVYLRKECLYVVDERGGLANPRPNIKEVRFWPIANVSLFQELREASLHTCGGDGMDNISEIKCGQCLELARDETIPVVVHLMQPGGDNWRCAPKIKCVSRQLHRGEEGRS